MLGVSELAAPQFIASAMCAFMRIADSNSTSREVRKVPKPEAVTGHLDVRFTEKQTSVVRSSMSVFAPRVDGRLLRRRYDPRALLRERAALQGQWLLAKQHLDHYVTRVAGIKRVLFDQVATVSDDLVGVLHDLELLAAIVPMRPHAFANHFKDIYDAERPVALVRTQLAMIGMIYRDQCINACIARRLKFQKLQFALELWEYADINALQPHRRLVQIDKFDTGDHLQDFSGGFHDASHAGMFVQRDPHFDFALKVRL